MPDICWVDFAHLFREGVISLENADKIPFFFFYRQCERIAFCWNNIFYDNTVNKWRAGGEVLYICDTLYRSACHFIHLALSEKKNSHRSLAVWDHIGSCLHGASSRQDVIAGSWWRCSTPSARSHRRRLIGMELPYVCVWAWVCVYAQAHTHLHPRVWGRKTLPAC